MGVVENNCFVYIFIFLQYFTIEFYSKKKYSITHSITFFIIKLFPFCYTIIDPKTYKIPIKHKGISMKAILIARVSTEEQRNWQFFTNYISKNKHYQKRFLAKARPAPDFKYFSKSRAVSSF